MMNSLVDYREFVGEARISKIYRKATKLCDKHVVHINSTYTGGGVAEMLKSSIPLMNEAGLDAGWRMVVGFKDFYQVTKKIHNALQGEDIRFTHWKREIYEETNKKFSQFTHLDHDLVIVHDPQPLPLIKYYRKNQPWLWRCHIDLSDPNEEVWEYLKNFALKYDASIFQLERFMWDGSTDHNKVLRPAIDPFSVKNQEIEKDERKKRLEEVGIDTNRPFIAQVSRYDKWKDPLGVVEVYKKLQERGIDCQLVLLRGMATDDPEGDRIYRKVRQETEGMDDVIVIVDAPDILVNAIQKEAHVVLQMSLREGFGLTVTEALWKRTPVVTTGAGGISLQIDDGKNGYQVEKGNYEEAAEKTADLLTDEEKRKKMGEAGRETVKEKYLMPRLIEDWIDILREKLL